MRTFPAAATAFAAVAAVCLAAGCSSSSPAGDDDASNQSSQSAVGAPATPAPGAKQVVPPPIGAKFDYQLGGAYPVPAGVQVVSRDSTASPAAGVYSICYINAFQAQPGTASWWQANHPDLLLTDADGAPVIDKDWNEQLLDVSTDAKRAALAKVEYAWIDACAAKGFQATEGDNLDSYQRSNGRLDASQAVAFATLLAQHAHADGLAVGQKNTTELLDRRRQIGFDFAVAEQCGATGECDQYATAYAGRVLDIEYDDAGFAKACQGSKSGMSVVRRDRDVSPAGSPKYVYRQCP
ncbi:hypothetical protein ABH935_001012 [Catenulispora sp. GAS73]|uniref:endo alpha-1,4 polygalactosaminidase n=1 Tax=Catenulispora sp. GAS73 TaxID=3156269 RepID=UPI003519917C